MLQMREKQKISRRPLNQSICYFLTKTGHRSSFFKLYQKDDAIKTEVK